MTPPPIPRMDERNPTKKDKPTPRGKLNCAVSTEKSAADLVAFFERDLLYMMIAKMHSAVPKIRENELPEKYSVM